MTNEYGVDVAYFKKELTTLLQSLPNRPPEELQRYLLRLAEVAAPLAKAVTSKPILEKKMFTVKVSKKYLTTFGDASLIGLCFELGYDFKDSLTIEFEQSSIGYRESHGPDEIIIPEFVPMCLAQDIVSLMHRGIDVKISQYIQNSDESK